MWKQSNTSNVRTRLCRAVRKVRSCLFPGNQRTRGVIYKVMTCQVQSSERLKSEFMATVGFKEKNAWKVQKIQVKCMQSTINPKAIERLSIQHTGQDKGKFDSWRPTRRRKRRYLTVSKYETPQRAQKESHNPVFSDLVCTKQASKFNLHTHTHTHPTLPPYLLLT